MDKKQIEEEEKKIKEQLQYTPYDVLIKLKQTLAINENNEETSELKEEINKKSEDLKKNLKIGHKNKNRPLERSSKIPVSTNKIIFESQRKEGRDPRFDNISGKLNTDLFLKSYDFLTQMKKNENKTLIKALKKKGMDQNDRKKLREALNQNKNELSNQENIDKQKEINRNFKKNMVKSVEKGKNPFFPKKKIIKTKILEEKFDKLQKSGKLDSYITNKNKQRNDKMIGNYKRLVKIKEMKSQI